MDGEWLTYQEAAVRLGVTPEAARRRAIRGKWARMPGNDGRTRVRVPDDWRPHGAPSVRPDIQRDAQLIKALEAHVETLKEQLAAAETRAEGLTANLAAERARTEKAIAAFAALAERLDALAAGERAKPWWRRLTG